MLTKISQLIEKIEQNPRKQRLVVCNPNNAHTLEAVMEARKKGIVAPILVGRLAEIEDLSAKLGIDLSGVQISDRETISEIVKESVSLVSNGEGDILMKGNVQTPEIMKGVLNKEWGIRTNKLISHLSVFEIPAYHKLILLTDAAMNIAPTLQEKAQIIANAVDFARNLGIDHPKVAAITAVENVNEKMPATLEASLLTMMNRRGQIKDCVVDGPLSFDLAISEQSRIEKGIVSDVAGQADILLAPDIEAGNLLYKCFGFFIKAQMGAVILGASAPIVLTSRADSEQAKLNSIVLAVAGMGKKAHR